MQEIGLVTEFIISFIIEFLPALNALPRLCTRTLGVDHCEHPLYVGAPLETNSNESHAVMQVCPYTQHAIHVGIACKTVTPLRITLGEYIGCRVIIIRMIGFVASLGLPSES